VLLSNPIPKPEVVTSAAVVFVTEYTDEVVDDPRSLSSVLLLEAPEESRDILKSTGKPVVTVSGLDADAVDTGKNTFVASVGTFIGPRRMAM
jgi:hypothetical protein